MKRHLSPSDYLRELIEAHHGDFAAVKTIFLNDRAALGVVATLLVFVNLSLILPGPEYKLLCKPLQISHVGLHIFSAMSALVCMWLGMQQYLKINMLPPEAACRYKAMLRRYEEPIAYLSASLLTLPIGVACGVYLMRGMEIGLISLVIILVSCVVAVILVLRSARHYHSAVHRSQNHPTGE